MYAGRLAEIGPVAEIIGRPRHPYTDGLMASTPAASAGQSRLRQIPGAMPRLGKLPDGCAFHPRCPRAEEVCRMDPRPRVGEADPQAACFFPIDPTERTSEDAA
jgi:peptide/nickel transport system ATP-binding protein